MIRPLVASFAALLVAAPLAAQAGYVAAPSTRATAEVSLTLADTAAQRAAGKPAVIRIDYGQPHLRGRSINTATLVPLGTVWRLGANAATLLTTTVDLTLGDKAVPKGRYVMMALPERSGWTLILQQETTGGDNIMVMAHDPAKDFVRVPLTATAATDVQETLSIALVPSTEAGPAKGLLTISWDRARLSTTWAAR
jgi:hypothetical protein